MIDELKYKIACMGDSWFYDSKGKMWRYCPMWKRVALVVGVVVVALLCSVEII